MIKTLTPAEYRSLREAVAEADSWRGAGDPRDYPEYDEVKKFRYAALRKFKPVPKK